MGSGLIKNGPSITAALVDASGTITSGGTSQEVFAANEYRKYLFIQNQSTADLWLQFGGVAVESQPSIRIPRDASFVMEGSFVSGQTVNLRGATTGQAFAAREA